MVIQEKVIKWSSIRNNNYYIYLTITLTVRNVDTGWDSAGGKGHDV